MSILSITFKNVTLISWYDGAISFLCRSFQPTLIPSWRKGPLSKLVSILTNHIPFHHFIGGGLSLFFLLPFPGHGFFSNKRIQGLFFTFALPPQREHNRHCSSATFQRTTSECLPGTKCSWKCPCGSLSNDVSYGLCHTCERRAPRREAQCPRLATTQASIL